MKIAIKAVREDYFQEIVSNRDIDIIYMGDETCFYRLEDIRSLKEKFKIAKRYNKEIYYALPIVQQIHLNEVLEIIKNIMEWEIKCTFIINDLGILYYLRENYIKNDYNVFLGRLLSRSGECCSWHNHIVRNESNFIKKVMYSNSTNSQRLVNYLKDFKVNGIEGNITEMQLESLEELKEKGYTLAMNYDYTYLTSSRICPTASYFKKAPPTCSGLCDKQIIVELSEIKDVSTIRPQFFTSDVTKDLQGIMHVMGNVVMKENTELQKLDSLSIYDSIIFDARRYNKNNWDTFLENIKYLKNDLKGA